MIRASILKGAGILVMFAGVACAETSEALMLWAAAAGLCMSAFGHVYAGILEERADYARRKRASHGR